MKAQRQSIHASESGRRRRILDAAREVFAAKGGLSAGLRPIAAAAGCTTGAIYAVFSGKEEIYAALLEQSLQDLATRVAAAAGKESDPETALRAAALEFYDYYHTHRFEYSLGLYLFEKDGRKGLGAERDKTLNRELKQSLNVFRACFERLGASEGGEGCQPERLAHSLFASLLGVLAMTVSGRDRSLGTAAEDVLETMIDMHLKNTVINRAS